MNKGRINSPGRRRFIKSVMLSGTGVMMVPYVLSGNSEDLNENLREADMDENNLLVNGDFQLPDPGNSKLPAGWEVGPQSPGISVAFSEEDVHSGARSVLQRRTVTDDYYFYIRQQVKLQPGAIYRLRFYARADEMSKDMFAVCISGQGSEGPSWLYHPVHLKQSDNWQLVDFIFRAQSGFNPLHTADIEFRLNQWRPDFSWRPNRPQDREVKQNLYIDSASLIQVNEGSLVPGRIARWLLVPGHQDLRVADVELGLGDGISMKEGSLKLIRNGKPMSRVKFIEDIERPDQFTFSERARKLYVLSSETGGSFDLNFEAVSDLSGNAMLGISSATGRALREGYNKMTKVIMHCDAKEFDRINWPITQGVPFPPGALADVSAIRVLGPDGNEVPAQVKPSSYWADDSIRWALFDFCINAAAGKAMDYSLEFGPEVKRKTISDGIKVRDNKEDIIVDSGRLSFRISKIKFNLLEDLVVDGRNPLVAPAVFTVTEANGKTFSSNEERPYTVAVEESGPMHAVIAVLGWNTNKKSDHFLTYSIRIHAYRNQPFVRVFYTLTNRHEEQLMGSYKYARGWPEDETQYQFKGIPQRNIADCTLRLKPKGISEWTFDTDDETIKGNIGEGASVHRQIHHAEGVFTTPLGIINTESVPGIAGIRGTQCNTTVAVFRYSNLFPKETRISKDGLELGLVPFSSTESHPLIKGTARTSEILLSFDPHGSDSGRLSARCFTDPSILSNQDWYCASRGFMGDPLIPVNKHTTGTYDDIINSYVENCNSPYPKGIDDCGLMNYGDFPYTGYNIWVNLEYDSDLGLYMHFARSGDRRAFMRGLDASRHFLDSDTGWYTGDFDTHGSCFSHNVAHYNPTRPAGHIYTLGLIHYYLLTGDRRALEATRMASECVNRVLYHRIHQYASLRSEEDIVGPKRGYALPGGSASSLNSRNTSDPSRYTIHSYLATGEARFLEASLSIAEAFVMKWPEVWRTDDDQYMHYRWPQVIGRLYDLTGEEHFRDTLLKCGKWMIENPYSKYGEFQVSQSYGSGPQIPSRQNNTRMLFLTAWAWKITGERIYLDWMINMFDAKIEQVRHTIIDKRDGKSLGKDADNPARGIAWVAPHRTVMMEPSEGRFQLIPPGERVWEIIIGNRSETPLTGKLHIGPLPVGVDMETSEDFELTLGEEKKLIFKINFTDEVASGRITVPYRISTKGTDGREGERNSFFAAHLLRPRTEVVPELIFHAPLDSAEPAFSFGGNGIPVIEVEDFVEGRIGKALGANAEGWTFNLKGSIFPEAGTFCIFMKPTDQDQEHGLFRILGHGWPFLGVFTNKIVMCNQPFSFSFADRAGDWLHIAMKWDLNSLAYYIDGKLVYNEKRINYEIPTGELWAMPQGAAEFDDVRIYSVALSDKRILDLARS